MSPHGGQSDPISRAVDLYCPECGGRAPMDEVQTLCAACERPWLVRYDLEGLNGQGLNGTDWAAQLKHRSWSLWRYAELLPLRRPSQRVDLGEGATPLLGRGMVDGVELLVKQEASNPSGSFKDRGLSVAINRARELGVEGVELPSAGNAGIAAAAYAAATGLNCRVAVPEPTPKAVIDLCRRYGAEVLVVGETLVDSGAALKANPRGYLSLATLREPYRVEGKKTLAFELAEQLGWELPDWVVFPTGGGTGIVAMHKAFAELRQIGLVQSSPKLVAVQSDGCAPLVKAFESGRDQAEPWDTPRTAAWGLKVPQAVGDRLTLRALRESGGAAVTVPEAEIEDRQSQAWREWGLVTGPEGAAALLAFEQLVAQQWIDPGQTTVVFQTGHPSNYFSGNGR